MGELSVIRRDQRAHRPCGRRVLPDICWWLLRREMLGYFSVSASEDHGSAFFFAGKRRVENSVYSERTLGPARMAPGRLCGWHDFCPAGTPQHGSFSYGFIGERRQSLPEDALGGEAPAWLSSLLQ